MSAATDVLLPRDIHPGSTLGRALAEAGGLWAPDADADPAAVVTAVRQAGVRALEIAGDLELVRELPELEFLSAMDPPDVAPVHALPRLRQLSFPGTWEGRLDGSAWPHLEWFGGVETPRDGGGLETVYAGTALRSLGVGRFPDADLTGVAAPRLEELSVGQSGRLRSLDGIARWSETLVRLEVDGLPNLASLDPVASLRRLEVLKLEGLRQVRTLDAVAALPSLRFLDVSELKGVETLAPLAGHPTLEYVAFGKTEDLDLQPLFEVPNLKLVWSDLRTRWNRDVHELPCLADVGPEDPRRAEWGRLTVG